MSHYRFFKTFFIIAGLLCCASIGLSQQKADEATAQTDETEIKQEQVKLFIDKIEVQGRLEKPQVMLFLPGQTPEIDDIQIERSFMKDIFRPVEKRITVETKYKAEYSKLKKSVIEW